MNEQKVSLPYTIKSSHSVFITLVIIFAIILGILTVAAFSHGKNYALDNLPVVYVFFLLILGLLMVFISGVKIILYPDRMTLKYRLYMRPEIIFFKDIKSLKRVNQFVYPSVQPILQIQIGGGKIVPIGIATLEEGNIRLLIETVMNANKEVHLDEWAEETKEGTFKTYYHYFKDWKQILVYIIISIVITVVVRMMLK